MTDYTGLDCPVCGEAFALGDDIVVCPECGAPYHRACYQKEGACLYRERHGTPDAWKPEPPALKEPAAKRCPRCGRPNNPGAQFCEICGQTLPKPEAPHSGPDAATQRCAACGAMNSRSALFCDHCGQSLTGSTVPVDSQNPGAFPGFSGMPGFRQMGAIFDPMGGVSPAEDLGGTSAGELAKLVQTNSVYYLPVFANLKKTGRNRFNFCSFLFSGGWMLYRKQYKWGSIAVAVMVALYVGSYLLQRAAAPIMTDLLRQAGVAAGTYPSFAQSMQAYSLASSLPTEQMLLCLLPGLLSILQFGVQLLLGFAGNRLYFKHCVKKVKTLHGQFPEQADLAAQLQERGGVNISMAICMLICYMIVVYVPQLL